MKSDEVVGLKIHKSSLPSWERGLKYFYLTLLQLQQRVAPLVGAWIEIYMLWIMGVRDAVAPLVGAWIEIQFYYLRHGKCSVAPLVGAWIEIYMLWIMGVRDACRSPRGSVD